MKEKLIRYLPVAGQVSSIRISLTDSSGTAAVMSETHYYPFGMSINALSYTNPLQKIANKYLYNSKELQDDLGLGWYDYGKRFYDAEVGRWHGVDPKAEKYKSWSVYQYVRNNPILRNDPNGMDDYKINRVSGAMELVKKTDDETHRVVKTYSRKSKRGEVKYKKNGEAKTAFGGVEKGILSDGINFQENNNLFEVGGEGQPSVDGIKSFTLQLSEYVGKEISGLSYSSNGSGEITDVELGKYKNNFRDKAKSTVPYKLAGKYGNMFTSNNVFQAFHTHPDGMLGATQSDPQNSTDYQNLKSQKPNMPNASFIILYRISGQIKPEEYPYTHLYKPKK
jgi:RHS repeat-associated protein